MSETKGAGGQDAAATADVLIVGGGLSGLYTAHLLHQSGVSFRVLEARSRLGGRIHTVHQCDAVLELGPSWFWPENNPRLANFVRQFDLPSFPQYTDGDVLFDEGDTLRRIPHRQMDPRAARRLTNGSRSLIDALVETLPDDWLLTGQQVTKISREDGIVTVLSTSQGESQELKTPKLILALPLRLLAATIEFSPALPAPVIADFKATPTWMAGEAKFFAIYDTPFWRNQGLSGTAISDTGPLSETHDASYPEGTAALFGFFLGGPDQRRSIGEKLESACLAQLGRYFGPAAESPIHTEMIDWSDELLTATPQDQPLAEHPQYGVANGADTLWDGRIRIAGTESAPGHGGYLEGALEAAARATADWI